MLVKALERERELIFDSGKKEGIDIGKKEGIDIGKKEGIQERNRQIAHAMSANGFAPPTIAQLLDLSLPEVEALLSQPATAIDETTAQDGSD
jgi:predicted transposase YdaD